MKQLGQHFLVGSQISSMVEHLYAKRKDAGSNPVFATNKKRKTVPVCCERWLMPHSQENVVHGGSQGGSGCLERRRRFLAESNCSQGRRKIKGRVATCDERNAAL